MDLGRKEGREERGVTGGKGMKEGHGREGTIGRVITKKAKKKERLGDKGIEYEL